MLLPIRYRFGKLDDGRKISFSKLLILKGKMVGVERTPTNVGSPTIVKLFICYYIELDKVSDTSPEPPVYKVRLFQVSK